MDIFCKIINGEIPSYTIYEDDIVKVFLDVNPTVNGHSLIVPKKHYKDIYDIDNDTLMHIINIVRKLGPEIEKKLNADGITLTQNNGLFEEVKHFHLHIRPQYETPREKLDIEKIYEILTK
ncbi:MAG: HIT domain-containing protein [Bacilli bacterium]|nr:HIT domain-containing protein [Bacilli bacterium]